MQKYIGVALVVTMALLFFVFERQHAFNVLSRIPIVGWVVEYNFPPSDFYAPLDRTPLRTGSFILKFECKYRGRHEVQIYGIRAKSDKAISCWESNVGMNIVIRSDNGRILYKGEKMNAQIMGGTNEEYNYCYAIFNAPDDVPLRTKLIAEITCYGEVKELLSHFPDAEIVAIKAFDK